MCQRAVDELFEEFNRRLALNHTPPARARRVPMNSADFDGIIQ
jgi:hypothetical protein